MYSFLIVHLRRNRKAFIYCIGILLSLSSAMMPVEAQPPQKSNSDSDAPASNLYSSNPDQHEQSVATNPSTTFQTVRGTVLDAESRQPLPGATVVILNTNPLLGASTDLEGKFSIGRIPLGRWDIGISFIGYEPSRRDQVLITAGKETVLEIQLTESVANLETVVVSSQSEQGKTLNEMATVSARSFSVEETGRYAAGIFDPARMAMNFAGVASSGDDLSNEIVVRGNSPTGLLWRLEGIEIPNPNHFSTLGGGGGAISMLSSSTLASSDFYTAAFPAEYGNATSGVFDLKLRKGNEEQREYALMVGLLGIEASAEGPFKKGSSASYLFNYRYSTLALLSTFLKPVGDILPVYQDLSFKIDVPTAQAGSFSLWGIGGTNTSSEEAEADSTKWETSNDREGYNQWQEMGVLGITHRYLLSDRTWMRTVVAFSADRYKDKLYYLDEENNYARVYDDSTNFLSTTARASWMLHTKLNARSSLRGGITYGQLGYRYNYQNADSNGVWTQYLNGRGNTGLAEAYAQYKFRFHPQWTLNAGLHSTLLLLNNAYAIEPRAALEWQQTETRTWSFAVGLHAKPENLSAYYLQEASPEENLTAVINQDLKLVKSVHGVWGVSQRLGNSWRIGAEAYGQYLYDVAISSGGDQTGAILNSAGIWDIVGVDSLESTGIGYNAGIDLTVERFFADRWYLLATGSVFTSKYRPYDGQWYSTRYDRRYTGNVVGGKEWPVGKEQRNTIGANGKVNFQGGNRQNAIDLEASREAGKTIVKENGIWADQALAYYRVDVGFRYTINRPRTTHSVMLDIQNVSNRQNVYSEYYDKETGNLEKSYQTGIFPFLNYRVEF